MKEEQYTIKCQADNTIKVNCRTPDNYRKLVTILKENNVIYHAYQLKEEPAFRIALKHIHHSTRTEEIQTELSKKSHQVRNIINGRHRVAKEPLNIFFIDLEPSGNNKEVYKTNYLQNKAVVIEPLRKENGIIQCRRCQQYGKKTPIRHHNKRTSWEHYRTEILWGCASKSNISIIQRSQSKILRIINNAPWYVNNQTLHTDLNIPYIKDVIREKSTSHHNKLANHPNDILQPLLEPQHNRGLRRHWPADLKEN
ncbi:hypothetical protein B7P43_G13902 [Cryptotermes secundus]|uniref:Pre-C2HC domain-containing protein n=1 Tax=Cryptotermes secundus TaxID=105785 RepID=A0A2J7Q2W3_9NEOP|nr:hypothetical protein B7P43_G13902 [Cryptotermes secundus]